MGDLISNLIGAIEDFSKGEVTQTFHIRAGDEHWNPKDLQGFLSDLDEKKIEILRQAKVTIVAGSDNEYLATVSTTGHNIEVELESPVPLFVSAIIRLAEEELERQRPPSSWYLPNAFFVLAWILVLGAIPWMLTRGLDASPLEAFLPFIAAAAVGAIGAYLRWQMPWVEIRASRDGFGWEGFRGRAWRAVLFLIPLALSIVFFVMNRSDSPEPELDYKSANEVNSLFVAAAIESKWSRPPTLSSESQRALLGSWDELSPYEIHRFNRIGSQLASLDQTWDNPNLAGKRLRLSGYVTKTKTIPIESKGEVTQLYELGRRGEPTRLECISSFPEGKQLRKGAYVTVIAVVVARGTKQASNEQRLTLAVCPDVRGHF